LLRQNTSSKNSANASKKFAVKRLFDATIHKALRKCKKSALLQNTPHTKMNQDELDKEFAKAKVSGLMRKRHQQEEAQNTFRDICCRFQQAVDEWKQLEKAFVVKYAEKINQQLRRRASEGNDFYRFSYPAAIMSEAVQKREVLFALQTRAFQLLEELGMAPENLSRFMYKIVDHSQIPKHFFGLLPLPSSVTYDDVEYGNEIIFRW